MMADCELALYLKVAQDFLANTRWIHGKIRFLSLEYILRS